MLRKTVVFIGPRASGKSTVAALLADRLGVRHFDSDDVLAEREGRPTAALLTDVGEPEFRRREGPVVLDLLARPEPSVLSLGGGAVLCQGVPEALSADRAHVVLLTADVEELVARLGAAPQTRPKLTDLDLESEVRHLLEQRISLYMRLADTSFDTGRNSSEQVVQFVLDALAEDEPGHP